MANNVKDLRDYFGVSGPELMFFWKSLTEEEKEYFRHADLT